MLRRRSVGFSRDYTYPGNRASYSGLASVEILQFIAAIDHQLINT